MDRRSFFACARTKVPTGLIVAAQLAALPVAAQESCGDRDAMALRLQSIYGEIQTGIGIGSSHELFELFTSDETGSWTILVTTPDGRSCLLASGKSWMGSIPRLPGSPT